MVMAFAADETEILTEQFVLTVLFSSCWQIGQSAIYWEMLPRSAIKFINCIYLFMYLFIFIFYILGAI